MSHIKYKHVINEQDGAQVLLILVADYEMMQSFQGGRWKENLLKKHTGNSCVVIYKNDDGEYGAENISEISIDKNELDNLLWQEDEI